MVFQESRVNLSTTAVSIITNSLKIELLHQQATVVRNRCGSFTSTWSVLYIAVK